MSEELVECAIGAIGAVCETSAKTLEAVCGVIGEAADAVVDEFDKFFGTSEGVAHKKDMVQRREFPFDLQKPSERPVPYSQRCATLQFTAADATELGHLFQTLELGILNYQGKLPATVKTDLPLLANFQLLGCLVHSLEANYETLQLTIGICLDSIQLN
jgi:hypothetical protein